ncbi:ribonuclease Z [Spirochaeta africana]|uniref:Ribonuclease Z n=1 Tax=Spirochaeta africana (strain ATCC 700263 / DSM 8902 / Z-7692) TaxID=889378 RepID=H9UIZ5_SPIAZ|nr:ribonuclease Z [Spirochaeta africana]AFG37488.1 ribonuclease Z [Spirochaeta africana DSM 8902]
MNLEAYILGTGGTMPLPGRFLTSVLLRREGDLLLFDCGEGTQVALRRLGLRWKKISAIFISHTHADHVTGLPGILMLSSQVDRDTPLYIYGPPKIREYVEVNRKALDMYINYEIIVREIPKPSLPDVVYSTEGYQVRAFPVPHSRTCYGYSVVEDPRPGLFHPEKARELGIPVGPLWGKLQAGEQIQLEDGRSFSASDVMGPARKGRKFTFITDSLPDPGLVNEMRDADLLICEGMYQHAEADTAAEKRHMTGVQAAALARDAGGVRQMGMVHFSPRYTKRDIQVIEDEARAVFPAAFAGKDGMLVEIPYVD